MDADSMAAHAEAEVSLTAEESEDQRKERVHAALHTDKTLPHMSLEEKCDFFDGYRVMGNTFFEEGRYEWARSTYMEAVTAIKYGIYIGCDDGPDEDVLRLGGPPRPVPQQAAQLLATLLLNTAQCHLMESNGKKALECCDKAEAVDCAQPPSFTSKVYFRRGEALRQMGDIHSAYAHLLRACRLQPQNAACRTAMSRAKKEMREVDTEDLKSEKTTWGGKLKAAQDGVGQDRDDAILMFANLDGSTSGFSESTSNLARQQRRRESESGFLGEGLRAKSAQASDDSASGGGFYYKPSSSADGLKLNSLTPSSVLTLLYAAIYELWSIFVGFARAIVSAWKPIANTPVHLKRRSRTPPWR